MFYICVIDYVFIYGEVGFNMSIFIGNILTT